MKTTTLAVLSALLMSAAGSPVFAMSHQEQLACAWTAGNCFDEAKILEKRITEIKDEIQKNANGSPEELKVLEKKLQETKVQLERIKSN